MQHLIENITILTAAPVINLGLLIDGILIGAGDARYLALAMTAAMLCYIPFALWVLAFSAGLLALWGALCVFMLARLYGMGRRYRGDAWLVTGATRT